MADLFLYNESHIAVLPLPSADVTKVHFALAAALAAHLTIVPISEVVLLHCSINC